MEKIFHITNGDYLAEDLKKIQITGEVIVCREALVAGPLQTGNLDDFWKLRSDFMLKYYNSAPASYYKKVVSEFEKTLNIPKSSEVNLWFEDDLFCQVNMWFCISLLSKIKGLKIYRIYPKASAKDHWKGFSISSSSDLKESLQSRFLFRENDIEFALNLWEAFKNNDNNSLQQLSENLSQCFKYLEEVIEVYLHTSPEDFIENLIEDEVTDFNIIFEKFQKEFEMLGFGDLQVKAVYDKILKEKQ
ncbi:hypothetical protein ACM39_01560 [Chryseobacterium sp. FH2]|uniref:DUF1835 domain-containing protein n=1 Tax=Chryseobacterium sp. FH2 TaxID=1674291 RepID=UPI00065ADAD9|nr:DUF1835 domain-containing protein [Chryseobacterium sp. FH2]KMQ69763.1 hypothetical protein ACM39_01560 [Chryseobacterium sp. FH2]